MPRRSPRRCRKAYVNNPAVERVNAPATPRVRRKRAARPMRATCRRPASGRAASYAHEEASSPTTASALTGTAGFGQFDPYNAFPRSRSSLVGEPDAVRRVPHPELHPAEAESNVYGSRETLRNTEQSILQSAAQSYMDVFCATPPCSICCASNIKVLEEQLRQTQDRFKVGEVTRTDVAQAEAGSCRVARRLLYPRSPTCRTRSPATVRSSACSRPAWKPAKPLERGLPPTLAAAIAISQVEHPSVQSALHQVDAAAQAGEGRRKARSIPPCR